MTITGILETGIYVDDVPRSAEFYRRIFEFSELVSDDRFCALSVADHDVLLIFKKGGTLKPLAPSTPQPPAFETAATTSGPAPGPNPADRIGWSIRRRPQSSVLSMTVPSSA